MKVSTPALESPVLARIVSLTRATVSSGNTDLVCGDGESSEEQGLVHADLRSGVALRGHDHMPPCCPRPDPD